MMDRKHSEYIVLYSNSNHVVAIPYNLSHCYDAIVFKDTRFMKLKHLNETDILKLSELVLNSNTFELVNYIPNDIIKKVQNNL